MEPESTSCGPSDAMLTVEQYNGHDNGGQDSSVAVHSSQPFPVQSQQLQSSEASSGAAGGGVGVGGYEKSEDGCDESNADSEGRAHKSRDERIREAKRQYQAERQRRLAELMAAQRQADELRRRQEAERRRRIEESRRRDAERRRIVEERRRRLEAAEMERRETLLRRLYDRDNRADSARTERRGRSGIAFAFGSSTPRDVSGSMPDMSAIGKTNLASNDSSSDATTSSTDAAAAGVTKRRLAPSQPALNAISETEVAVLNESESKPSSRRTISAKVAATKQQQQRKSLFGSQLPPRRGVSMTDVSSVRSQKPTVQVSSAGSEAASSPARKSRQAVKSSLGTENEVKRSKASSVAAAQSDADKKPRTPIVAGRKASVDNAAATMGLNSRMTASVIASSSAIGKADKLASPRKPPALPRTPVGVSNSTSGTAKSSLMTKSMIDLPSAKKVRTRQLFNSTPTKSSRRAEAAAAVPAGLKRPPIASAAASPSVAQQQQRSAKATSSRSALSATSAAASPAVPKSQSAQDLKQQQQQPAGEAVEQKASIVDEESRDTNQVSVSSVLPDVDASDAKRRFEEQRRLHREKLEADKRAEEERRQREEEFRRRRVEEQRRREEEARQREAESRLAKEAEERAEAAAAEERALIEAQRLKEKEEADRQAREREERERQERLAAEETDRLERRKKLEAIMNRVKVGGGPASSGSPTPDKQPQPPPTIQLLPASSGNEDVRNISPPAAAAADEDSNGDDSNDEDANDESGAGGAMPLPMTVSMPPALLSQELQLAPKAAPSTPQTLQQQQPAAVGSPALSALAGRLKGTKAAEILARHSSQQNLAASAAAASSATTAVLTPAAPAADSVTAAELETRPDQVQPAEEEQDEDVDPPGLLSSTIETRLAEVRARLRTTDATDADTIALAAVDVAIVGDNGDDSAKDDIKISEDEEAESGVGSPTAEEAEGDGEAAATATAGSETAEQPLIAL